MHTPRRSSEAGVCTASQMIHDSGSAMNLLNMFSDDQLAIGGCLLALVACGLIAAVSYHFGPAGRDSRGESPSLPMQPASTQKRSPTAEDRRAA
jgi:hypothetical protein